MISSTHTKTAHDTRRVDVLALIIVVCRPTTRRDSSRVVDRRRSSRVVQHERHLELQSPTSRRRPPPVVTTGRRFFVQTRRATRVATTPIVVDHASSPRTITSSLVFTQRLRRAAGGRWQAAATAATDRQWQRQRRTMSGKTRGSNDKHVDEATTSSDGLGDVRRRARAVSRLAPHQIDARRHPRFALFRACDHNHDDNRHDARHR